MTLRSISLGSFSKYLVSDFPEHLKKHPSMMSPGEKQFLYGIARNYYTGHGRIIDAGVFLGASTLCLGQGL